MVKPLALARSVPQAPAGDAMTLLVGGVIVHDRPAGRVLLPRRSPGAGFGQGLWHLPVGRSQDGEPVIATAVRDLREETGLVAETAGLRLVPATHAA
jgi:8-oxo-dGTP pyrophosphatase MutT (NUDIX family)